MSRATLFSYFSAYLLLVLIWPCQVFADGVPSPLSCMPTQTGMQDVNLLPYTFHFWDASDRIEVPGFGSSPNLSAILKQYDFKKVTKPGNEYVLGKGRSNHWVRFCLTNPSDTDQELVLATSPAVLGEIDFYPQKEGAQSYQTGSTRPMSSRDIHSPEFHFNISLASQETQEFYLRINSRTSAYLIASVWSQDLYLITKDKLEGIDGILAGILLGLILYTMLLYFSVRQSSSLLYILWSASTLILFASIDGRVLQYLLPNTPSIAYYATVLFYPLSVLLSALFAREFIRLKDYPRLNRGGNRIIVGFLVVVACILPFGYATYFKVNAAYAFVVVMYFGLVAPLYGLIARGSVLCRYLLIAQLPLIICILDRSLFTMGLTEEHYVTYTPKVGLVAEMILLAYCIGLTIYREKDQAQHLALKQLNIANDLKSNYKAELETEIKKNTAEIRSMNQDLEQQAAQLLELDEVKSKFFANISHEFRTPLTLIQGPLTGLIDREETPNKDIIRGAIRHSKALQALIDQLLLLSKFDGQSLTLKTTKVNASKLVRSMVSQFSSLAETKQIELGFESTAPSIEAYVDIEKLQIVINNLVNNAIKFTPINGEVSVEVSSTAELELGDHANDEYLQICVRDTGEGIPADELDQVFDRFFQAKSSSQEGSGVGTGIGLSLVKELTTLHAGEVLVSSAHSSSTTGGNTSSGTTFTIRLPLGLAHLKSHEIDEGLHAEPEALSEDYAGRHMNQATRSIEENASKHATILVVDDNDDMRSYIRGLLESDYQVVEAVDGLNAQEMVAQNVPDLIVTDLMMPKRDGLQFVESLKKDGEFSKIPVIMLTAKAGLDDRLKGLASAVDDYLAKPFEALELKVRIQNLLTKGAQFKAFYQTKLFELGANGVADPKEDAFITKMNAVVHARLSEHNFGVNELAEEMHVSKATLQRRVSAKTKFSASEYIRHCRLEKARQLSIEGELRTIGQLANAVGFNQAGYFSKLYQKTFNSLPLAKN